MADEQPWVRVERGTPTPEEVAALVAALSATRARGGSAADPAGEMSAWARAARAGQRTPDALPPPGPGAWRLSALPTRA